MKIALSDHYSCPIQSCSPVMEQRWLLISVLLWGRVAGDGGAEKGMCVVKEPESREVLSKQWNNVTSSYEYVRKTVTVWRDKQRCCSGYVSGDTNGTCMPLCPGGCGIGKCTAPFTCSCPRGTSYIPFGIKCISQCPKGCLNGVCKGPNLCECDNGFKEDPKTNQCLPVCEDECVHGNCTAHNICTCHTGYVKYSAHSSVCKPVCYSGCVHGDCTAPNVCSCHDGYHHKSTHKANVCVPQCEGSCVNGDCTAPGTCTCHMGYIRKNASVCVPICSERCVNGQCSAPENCQCKAGYQKDSKGTCVPSCEPPCVIANCTQIGTSCTCPEGYVKSEGNSNTCIRLPEKITDVGSQRNLTVWLAVSLSLIAGVSIMSSVFFWYWRRKRVTSQCNDFYNPVYMSERLVLAISETTETKPGNQDASVPTT